MRCHDIPHLFDKRKTETFAKLGKYREGASFFNPKYRDISGTEKERKGEREEERKREKREKERKRRRGKERKIEREKERKK
jgi:hypothetical protein